ncbi:MAG: hypothetical protein ACYC1M_19270 [Armatimonadota bacterium]
MKHIRILLPLVLCLCAVLFASAQTSELCDICNKAQAVTKMQVCRFCAKGSLCVLCGKWQAKKDGVVCADHDKGDMCDLCGKWKATSTGRVCNWCAKQ